MPSALIIDDSKTVRVYHKDILQKAGFDVNEAENGMEGLEKCLNNAYDLYLVDINMPIMDGYTFVERLREQDATASVVMISTEAEEGDRFGAFKVGATAYMLKPVKPDALACVARIFTQA
jgi:two-component system chemotaxis response regulator CheY